MEEIYDKECLKEGLEMIEGMTVKEIRRGLPKGYGFFISGDSSWAILKADKTKDDNKALAEMYGYEGGTESPLVKITFTIPKEHFKRLMPIKQGDVFGIENLTNKATKR